MKLRILSILVLLSLTAGACNDDSETDTGDSVSADQPSGDSTDSNSSNDSDDAGSDDDSANTTDVTKDDVDTDFTGSGSDDFCEAAREFDENDPTENLSIFDGETFFDSVDEAYGEVLDLAPDEIKPDFETLLSQFHAMQDVLEQYDYDVLDPDLAIALDELDATSLEAAADRVAAYLEDVCGIENSENTDPAEDGSLDGFGIPDGVDLEDLDNIGDLDPEAQNEIFAQLGIDAELAACLRDELGADFSIEDVDATILTKEVCGTTILEILSGVGG